MHCPTSAMLPLRLFVHSLRACVLLAALANANAFAQAAAASGSGAAPLRDFTFPTFANGDGRQKLSEFHGQPLLVVTFADVWGQTAGIDRAMKLLERYGKGGLQVVLAHTTSGGTFADGAGNVDPAAWAMRRYPGCNSRLCGDLTHTPWNWSGLGMPPYWAVIGPDGTAFGTGSFEKGAKELDAATHKAMEQFEAGWGTADEAALRKLLHHKGDLLAARAKATGSLSAEVDAVWKRRLASAEWLLTDGQWLRAKAEFDALALAAAAVPEWKESLATMSKALLDATSTQELDLDAKLQTLVKPLQSKSPAKDLPKRLRDFAKKHEGAAVAKRAERLAALAEQALAIR